MNNFINNYFSTFIETLNTIEVSDDKHINIDFKSSVEDLNNRILQMASTRNKLIMIGNGGSAGICSHQVTDYLKNGKIRSQNFSDSSLLTCLSNDFSFEEVFSKPIEMFAESNDIVYCFSSSGRSRNILNAAESAKKIGCFVVTFSGFDKDNDLRKLGDLNYYVNSNSYGHVEIIHLFISHIILDNKLFLTDKINIFEKNKK